MAETKTKAQPKAQANDLKRAEQLMREYAQLADNKAALMAQIKNELDAYSKNMKEAEAELLEIGARNRHKFDDKGNLVFADGYLHVVNSTVVVTARKFDLAEFHEVFPDLVDVKLKTGAIKKLFLNEDSRKELSGFGVKLDTEESLQVIIAKI
jgi:hypothetical protein